MVCYGNQSSKSCLAVAGCWKPLAARRGDPVAEEVGSPSQDGGPQHGDRLGPVPAVPTGSGAGRPPGSAGIEWIEGSADTGSADARLTDGLRWSFELELGEVLAAAGLVGGDGPDDPGDPAGQEQSPEEEPEFVEADGDREPGRDLTGLLAEHMAAGPGLAAWLADGPSGEWSDWDLPGVAASYRRVAAWAQAEELAAVAAMTSRAAARDPKAGVDPDGRPAALTPSATSEVSLALTMSHLGASWWADLAVTLRWRLKATGAALAAGTIDLQRARLFADATTALSDELAQLVEERVLPSAGDQTTGQLRAALRRAVITVDPRAADDRRREAEHRAKVSLYADDSGTAALVGSNLPAVHAAAAMARLTALARGLRASGAGGRLDLLRSQVFIGLLLGTLPLIPPGPAGPPDSPPDAPPGPADPEIGCPPPGDGSFGSTPPDPYGGGGPDDAPPPSGTPPGERPPPPGGRTSGHRSRPDQPGGPPPRPADGSRPPARSASGPGTAPSGDSGTPAPAGPDPAGPDPAGPVNLDASGSSRADDSSWRDVPPPGDADAPPADQDPPPDPWLPPEPDPYDIDRLAEHPAPPWSSLPPTVTQIPPVLGDPPPGVTGAFPLASPSAGPDSGSGRPPPGLLDLTISWSALTGQSDAPAQLGRIGPITATQAIPLAAAAASDPHAAWRVILTDTAGLALAVERLRRPRAGGRPPGVFGRVTVVVPAAALAQPPPAASGSPSACCPGGGILAAVRRAASRAAAREAARQAADAAAPGGCAHTREAPGYRPPPRIREYVAARDQTCRSPTCRQPAWQADLDHTVPYDQGGRTCACNIGGFCRTHHQVKQEPGWDVAQPRPGNFQITTPAGRTYDVHPDPYAAA
jgi:hypothetical protein